MIHIVDIYFYITLSTECGLPIMTVYLIFLPPKGYICHKVASFYNSLLARKLILTKYIIALDNKVQYSYVNNSYNNLYIAP